MSGTLRVAYLMRVDALDKPGGDVEHMRLFIRYCTAAALRRGLTFEGEILTSLSPSLQGFDVVHLTNLDRPVDLYAQFQAALAATVPRVLTPLHHSYREISRYERMGRGGAIGRISGYLGFYRLEILRILVKSRRYPQLRAALWAVLKTGVRRAQAEVLRGCRYVLITTLKEGRDIEVEIGAMKKEQVVLVRHGLDETAAGERDDGTALRDIRIAAVARIESRKNQLRILDAADALKQRVTFVGPVNPNHSGYAAALRRRIGSGPSNWIPGIPASDVPALLRRAQVHIAASWFEVASLVDLEAYLQGCRVVASRCGGTHELLGDDAFYVDPERPEDIRTKLEEALASADKGQKNNLEGLRKLLPTWSEAGDHLLDIYLSARDQTALPVSLHTCEVPCSEGRDIL